MTVLICVYLSSLCLPRCTHHLQFSSLSLHDALPIWLGFFGTLRFVVLPQAFRTMVQPLVNVFIGTVIGSALCSAIAVSEITWVTQSLNIQYAQAVVMFLVAGVVYLSMSLGGAFLGGAIERAVAPSGRASRASRTELNVQAGAQA